MKIRVKNKKNTFKKKSSSTVRERVIEINIILCWLGRVGISDKVVFKKTLKKVIHCINRLKKEKSPHHINRHRKNVTKSNTHSW